MSIFPPIPIQSPKPHPSMEEMRCPSPSLARMHLIKGKDAIDRYLAMHIKGLSKQEAAAYRNSYKKNICIDMLRQGYHKSFAELFTLIEKWNALREASGPGSAIWLEKSLEEQPDKLDQLHYFLTRAEAAQRSEYYEEVYANQLNLAYCFNKPEDRWLRNYFYEQCYKTAQLIKIDGGKKEAEAHSNMGLVYEEQGHFLKAVEHYEAFYNLTVGRTWKDDTGRYFNSLACEHLWRIYTLLADKMLGNKEHQEAIGTLIKAFRMAKEEVKHLSGNIQTTGRLCWIRESISSYSSGPCKGNYYKACEYFNQAFEAANALSDLALVSETKVYCGIGKAHSLMVKVNTHTEAADPINIKYLLDWKENRSDMFADPFTVDAKQEENTEDIVSSIPTSEETV
ncbi:tetratricopeptide repeat protein 29 isoform 3-T3 [Liasis olivaceus]